MTITTLMAQNALYVSGGNATINYTKYVSSGVPDITFYVSSSATNFYIDLVPTSSTEGISFKRQDNSLINEQNKLRLYANSQVKVPIVVKIDSSNFNDVLVLQKSYDIVLKITPIEIPVIDIGNSGGGSGGGGGGGGGGVGSTLL